MARLEPTSTETTDPFWEATRERRYLVQWCTACRTPIFYPREVCPACLTADALGWKESTGKGTVHAVSVQHRPGNPTMSDRVPYVVALVDLDAGDGGATIRVMSNVVNCDPERVHVGDHVDMVWESLTDGRMLALFELASGA
jgi:uncharacterized OB-fold protein